MIVQSFAPPDCKEHAVNRSDFNRFVAVVGTSPMFEGTPVRLAWVDDCNVETAS
jgi:hypothetical protein